MPTSAAFGPFTPLGPIVEKLVALPNGVRDVAIDEEKQKYYALTGHEVNELDLETGKLTRMDIDIELPRLSWPCGLTFDTKRRRLLLASFGGVGYLYRYDVDERKWSVLCDLNNLDLCALTYMPSDDALYGIAMPGGSEAPITTVYKFNTRGAVVGSFTLSRPMAATQGPHQYCQMVPVGEQLVILGAVVPNPNGTDEFIRHSYVVDPKSGKVVYSCVMQPVKDDEEHK